ncbi:MAG: hypothetical protein KAI47_17905, partial [Deltaproteobacteria bacterium]|nr:hypothetical protein [Deltaproteobacteria bacterium]
SWSEGNKKKTAYFRGPPAGTYKLLVKANGGRWPSTRLGAKGENIVVRVYSGIVRTRYFLISFIVILLISLFLWRRGSSFERRRWASVMEDDDDDDWDD